MTVFIFIISSKQDEVKGKTIIDPITIIKA